MGKPVNIALIGCGTIGSIRALIAAQNPGVGTLHLYDIRAEAARELADRVPGAVVHQSAESAVSAVDLSGCIVSTSEFRHAAPVKLALSSGLTTLVEKPLVHEPVAALAIAAEAERRGVPVYVGYTQRFRRRYLSGKDLVLSGTLGAMTGATAKFFATQAIARKILARSPQATPSAAVITYLVDLLLWYAEPSLPARVHARSTMGAAGGQYPDSVATTWALLELEGGQVLNVGTSWDLPSRHPAYNATISMDVFGTDGFLTIDDSHRDVMVTSAGGITAPYTPDITVNTAFIGSHAPGDVVAGRLWGPIRSETNEFIESLSSGIRSSLLTGVRHAANVVQVTTAIDASAATGEPVELTVGTTAGVRHVRRDADADSVALVSGDIR